MAKAREGCGWADSLEAELTCPICLGLYQEPVSLSCGHSFCRQCIEKVLGTQQNSQSPCPTCRTCLGPNLELQKNFKLGSIVEAFQTTTSDEQRALREGLQQDEGAEEGESEVVPCEYCLDEPQPALKTCLVCEVSLCRVHLSKHNARGFHQEHILVDVGAGKAEERRCQDHGKLLECYCLGEEECICVLCCIAGAHKGHKVITMKEGHDRQLVKLIDTMKQLEVSKNNLITALEDLQESENQIKNNTKTLTSQLEELFEKVKMELDKKMTMILSDIQSNEEENLEAIANTRKEMEQKRDQAEQNLQALQEIKEQPDVFLFFRELQPVTDRIASLDLRTKSVKVQKAQLDQRMLAEYETRRERFMLHLDSVLANVRDKFHQLNGAKQEGIIEKEQLKNLSENFNSTRARYKKDRKKCHQNSGWEGLYYYYDDFS
ncbi:E3 ubiquitin/ISG15 ligase TRIM25-like [Parus major]|uniref:E3 ubiquitin/ISG15 ligase TRIM25-like n=1 Tax=Parus major TaxID=9157 RepID=UPI0007712ABE|nr:E3 ubiquitin/ISG15 ligase TRIM25-like [Parus major]XP_015497443.1 E3 ubiquitin/ISG15 ligase TRIM25-like [Parus major]XP_018863708.1 E3 ubiquitin/ISG15 ligase TRIM25-like [Parus major]